MVRNRLGAGVDVLDPREAAAVRIRLRKARETRPRERDRADERVTVRLDETGKEHVILERRVDRDGGAGLLRGIKPWREIVHRASDRKDATALDGHGRRLGPTRVHGHNLSRGVDGDGCAGRGGCHRRRRSHRGVCSRH